ncbi:Ig-like domain-containing protein [Faecalitalea cylindroides]|uniref:Ig-like domain-containing protein n=1 Tax=Faecalitalea cylindroides TaxID=39483 RepID=UPI00189992EF|nr:Ig-like domain-containing protein [Faecalitalea cylindroides]
MKKRIWNKVVSIFTAILLVVGIVPNTTVTALAAAPDGQVLYVGGVQISSTGYWTTDSEGNVTAYSGAGTPSDNYIHYDADTNTLTLHNTTIKKGLDYNESIQGGTFILGSAIGVFNQNGDAELTITLEGDNTIAEVGKGIYVLAISTGGATLTITGDGSLDASASQTGIWVQSNNGNGALFIQNAKVEAMGTNTAGYGVNVQSSQSSTASLSVDGGSLTASGAPGILYDSSGSGTIPNTTTLTISNSAIVDARGGGIGAGYIWNLSGVSPTDDSVGIVFGLDLSDSKAGAVYGDVTLQEDLEIGEGESLTIPNGSALNGNGKLTNNGTIIVEKGGNLTGNPGGIIVTAPAITTDSLPNGTVGESYTATLEATGNNITWSASGLPDGLTLNSDGTITGTPTAEGTSTVTVKAENSAGSTSKDYTLNIKPATVPVTGLELNKNSLTLQEKDSDTLTVTVKPADATNQDVTWQSSNTSIATVSADGTVTAISAGTATITATAADGSGVSASCTLTVTHGKMVHIPKKDATCTEYGNEEYWICENCGKYFSDANGDTEIAKDSWIISAINHDWNDAVYTWSDDGSTCTATRTCKHDSAHTETSKATVTGAQTKAPTCTEKGETTYTATFEADWAMTQTKVLADISATGHSYGEPVWSWSEDGKTCTVTFTCENDATHKESPKVTVTAAVKKPATCTEAGVTTYTATVEFNGNTYTDTKDVADIPAIGHKLTKTEAKAPTSTDTGNIEYWYCEVCNKYFSDEKAEHEITLEDTIIAKLPKFVSGANQEWTKGSKEGLTFKIDTDIKEFKKVLVDGKELKDTDYDIKSGSTILTLKPSFLDTLSAGKHKIRFEFNTGSVEAYFTVKDKENSSQTESANTGVQNKYGLWIVLLLVAAGGLAGFGILSKRRKNHK